MKAADIPGGLVKIIMATGRQPTLKSSFCATTSSLEQSSSKRSKLTVDESFDESDNENELM